MVFDYDKAYSAFAAQPDVQKFMEMNKAQLVALGIEQIQAVVMAYVVGGNASTAMASVLSLDQQAAAMVTGSADVAQRRYEAGQRMMSLGELGLKILVAILAAGVAL